MEEMTRPNTGRKRALIKLAVLIAFILAAIYVVRYSPLKEYLNAEALR